MDATEEEAIKAMYALAGPREKRGVGRPRVHPSDTDRKRAWRHKQAEEMKQLKAAASGTQEQAA